jgi:hypothetical protein
MSARQMAVGLFITVATLGCSPTVSSIPFLSPAPSPQAADHPILLFNETRPACPYQEVGSVVVRQGSSDASVDKLVDALRVKAREMGGDAIIGVGQSVESGGGTVIGHSVIASNKPVVSGTVVRFSDPSCTH